MPGLYTLSCWEPLPLKSSRVKACANGYSLSITAHLVYTNPCEEPVEGKGGVGRDLGCLRGPPKAHVLEIIPSPAHLGPSPQTLLGLGSKGRGQGSRGSADTSIACGQEKDEARQKHSHV